MAAERSGAGRLIVHADQELPAFLELESAIKTYRHNHECDCPEPDEELENVADNRKKAVFRCGCISMTDQGKRQFRVVGCRREDAGRFIVHAHFISGTTGWKVMCSSMFC